MKSLEQVAAELQMIRPVLQEVRNKPGQGGLGYAAKQGMYALHMTTQEGRKWRTVRISDWTDADGIVSALLAM